MPFDGNPSERPRPIAGSVAQEPEPTSDRQNGANQRPGSEGSTLRDPELSVDPNKYAPKTALTFEDGVAHFRGYQEFTFAPRGQGLRAVGADLIAKDATVGRAFAPRFMAGRTVLDLGGNNGYFALKALAAGAASASVVDMDPECILNLERVRSWFPDLPLEAHCRNTETWKEPRDVVVAFALVHWLYSCTGRALSLDRIVGALASLARDLLLIEWVDPADPAVQGFHHTHVAEEEAAGPYHFGPFLLALSAHFSRVELLGELSPTRRIYLATRRPLPDLSWAAPLLFPVGTLLTSRMVWSVGDVEFWSRVYRVGGSLYRQCSPDLAERELAGARALGTKVEVLERHEGWWLLHSDFVDGETLDEAVERASPSREDILQVTLKLVDRVATLEEAGVVHRDLHPANIIVDRNGNLHLIDFGWASVPGVRELSPDCIGRDVEMPATRTLISVRPPEASGSDLFAVGRIVAWMNTIHDPQIDFLAAWLGHPDHRLRLREVDLARQLVKRLRESAAEPLPPRAAKAGRLDEQLMRLVTASHEKTLRLDRQAESERKALQQERDSLLQERSQLLSDLAAARAQASELEASRARHRFPKARALWSLLKNQRRDSH